MLLRMLDKFSLLLSNSSRGDLEREVKLPLYLIAIIALVFACIIWMLVERIFGRWLPQDPNLVSARAYRLLEEGQEIDVVTGKPV